jgi:thiamine-monophosphate kinase
MRPLSRIHLGPGPEFDLIRDLLGSESPLPPGVLVGPGDDCAVMDGGFLISSDLVIEGVHFRREWVSLEEAGFRAAVAGLSDLAAMAAEPLGILLSLAVDPAKAQELAKGLQTGAEDACAREGVAILGGDLSASPGPMVMDVVALGRSQAPVHRVGALPGDEVWVTGWLGGSGAAVHLWKEGREPPAPIRESFVRPRPRLRESRWLLDRAPIHSMLDLSDGLAGDAGHLSRASGVGLILVEGAIPIHPSIKTSLGPEHVPLHFALEGGEDYELCLTAPPGALQELRGAFREAFGLPLTQIGRVVEGEDVLLERSGGELRPLARRGFSHFQETVNG